MRVRKNAYYKLKGEHNIFGDNSDYIVKVVFIRNYQCVFGRVRENINPRLTVWPIKRFCEVFEKVPEIKSKLLYDETKSI